MWIVTGGAAFAHRGVLKNERPGLFTVALRAGLVQTPHREPSRRLHDIQAMRVMALHTVHLSLSDGMMLRKMEFGIDVQMTFVTGLGILPGVDDELLTPRASNSHVFACRAVARFAAVLAYGFGVLEMQPGMRTRGERTRDFGMTIGANLVTNKGRPLDHGRHHHRSLDRGT